MAGGVTVSGNSGTPIGWQKFDYDDRATTAPPAEKLVWIVEDWAYDGGVGIGYFDGYTMRTWWGSDDCHVTYWAKIVYPTPPEVTP
jgi:hypothetical protein